MVGHFKHIPQHAQHCREMPLCTSLKTAWVSMRTTNKHKNESTSFSSEFTNQQITPEVQSEILLFNFFVCEDKSLSNSTQDTRFRDTLGIAVCVSEVIFEASSQWSAYIKTHANTHAHYPFQQSCAYKPERNKKGARLPVAQLVFREFRPGDSSAVNSDNSLLIIKTNRPIKLINIISLYIAHLSPPHECSQKIIAAAWF